MADLEKTYYSTPEPTSPQRAVERLQLFLKLQKIGVAIGVPFEVICIAAQDGYAALAVIIAMGCGSVLIRVEETFLEKIKANPQLLETPTFAADDQPEPPHTP